MCHLTDTLEPILGGSSSPSWHTIQYSSNSGTFHAVSWEPSSLTTILSDSSQTPAMLPILPVLTHQDHPLPEVPPFSVSVSTCFTCFTRFPSIFPGRLGRTEKVVAPVSSVPGPRRCKHLWNGFEPVRDNSLCSLRKPCTLPYCSTHAPLIISSAFFFPPPLREGGRVYFYICVSTVCPSDRHGIP